MQTAPTFLSRIIYGAKVAGLLIFILYMIFLILYAPIYKDRQDTKIIVPFILSRHITMDDVLGTHLPPAPDQQLNDSTLKGIDINKNGIRDDVEIAIFKLHPNEAKVRAAELQYAMALQQYMTDNIFNSETLIAAMHIDDKAITCIDNTVVTPEHGAPEVQWIEQGKDQTKRQKEVEDLVLNISSRKNKYEEDYKKYMTSYALNNNDKCDLDPTMLKN